eukprot:3046372-Pyramimonas_sp.AAC.2
MPRTTRARRAFSDSETDTSRVVYSDSEVTDVTEVELRREREEAKERKRDGSREEKSRRSLSASRKKHHSSSSAQRPHAQPQSGAGCTSSSGRRSRSTQEVLSESETR